MSIKAADDVTVIRRQMEYERGFQAGLRGATRSSPDVCLDRPAWLEGYDEGMRLKPKEEVT